MATLVETFSLTGGKYVIPKDPNAVLDYSFDWGPWLTRINDTIASVEWIVETPLVLQSQNNSDTAAIAFIAGGIAGKTLRVTCRITTVGGRIDDRSIFLKIVER